MKLPQPVAFTVTEGGVWVSWASRESFNSREGIRFHAIRFDDGSVFEMYGGWRARREEPPMGMSHWGIHKTEATEWCL
jgi:hypothetical protein